MWRAKWTGSFPNLCHGVWKLWHDDEEIPKDKILFNSNYDGVYWEGEPANTYGTYYDWSFGEDWIEEWHSYEHGLDCDEWCEEYSEWLSTLAPKEEWPEIYDAFNILDWRHGSCGGCI